MKFESLASQGGPSPLCYFSHLWVTVLGNESQSDDFSLPLTLLIVFFLFIVRCGRAVLVVFRSFLELLYKQLQPWCICGMR